MMFRLAWTFGFITTREYSARTRTEQYGREAGTPTDAALQRLETTLIQDRLALVIFLVGVIILAYTALNAPH